MSDNRNSCAKVAGPVCLFLAERWRDGREKMDDGERHNLEMATIAVLHWISIGDERAAGKLARATSLLPQRR